MYVRPRYRRPAAAPTADSPSAAVEQIPRRSHIAIVPALILLGVGWYMARYTILFPAIIGFFLLSGGLGLLGSRLNPLSTGFYLTTKPSWTAIGTVLLTSVALLWLTYEYYLHSWGPLLPHVPTL